MTTQPAVEQPAGTLNLTGQGNAPSTPISDALVVDATKAGHQLTDDEWQGMSDSAREHASTCIRRSLEAAYPAIRQHVAEQIAAKAHEIAEQFQATAVTHRDLSHEHGRTTQKGTSHMNTAHAYRNKADGAWAVAHAAREIGGGQ